LFADALYSKQEQNIKEMKGGIMDAELIIGIAGSIIAAVFSIFMLVAFYSI